MLGTCSESEGTSGLTYLGHPTVEWDPAVASKGEELAGRSGHDGDAGKDVEDDDDGGHRVRCCNGPGRVEEDLDEGVYVWSPDDLKYM